MNSKMNIEYFQVNKIGLSNGSKRVIEACCAMGRLLQVFPRQKDHMEPEKCTKVFETFQMSYL